MAGRIAIFIVTHASGISGGGYRIGVPNLKLPKDNIDKSSTYR
jgi:hypothetical protein